MKCLEGSGSWRVLGVCWGLMLVFATSCGPSATGICDDVCDCVGCSESEFEECVDSIEDAEREAEREGCDDQFDDYLSCIADELECRNDKVDADGCESLAKDVSKCAGGIVVGVAGACGILADQILACCDNDPANQVSCEQIADAIRAEADNDACQQVLDSGTSLCAGF